MCSLTTIAVLATILLAVESLAKQNKYTVWSSVVFSRTGERTPVYLGYLPVILTPLGANQSYTAGSKLRNRYFGKFTNHGVGGAPIQGLSANNINFDQIYIGTQDMQYTAASALAFLQGFYPPINQTTSDTVQQDDTAPVTNILADGTVVSAPLHNYQYPLIQTYDGNCSESIYLGAQQNCPAVAIAAETYEFSEKAQIIADESGAFYQKVGSEILSDVYAEEFWTSHSAWYIYDYANYMNTHDASSAEFLGQDGNLQRLKWYSDQQLEGWYGNLYAINNVTSEPFRAPTGSIGTIAGNFLASQLLGQLQVAIANAFHYYKLNLLFGDFQPLMSFFALSGLSSSNPDFYGMVDFASVAVFELYSLTDGSDNPPLPSEEDLWVRFYFRNGTDDDYHAYPLFGRSPDTFEMTWNDFEYYMYQLVPGGPGDWCHQCDPPSMFCAYWDASYSLTASELISSHYKVTPVIAGVIGALVALVVAGIIFAAVMLIGRFRFHRIYNQKNETGGYKGSQKLASDKDLVIPKGGAVVETEETPGSPARGGHERVGSWELKQNEAGLPNIGGLDAPRRPSYENDDIPDIGAAPWQKPVQPDERV